MFANPSDGTHPPSMTRCDCVLREDLLANAERVMPGLSTAPSVTRSSLAEAWSKNIWVTANSQWFSAHLRHVAVRRPPVWAGRVVSDADLVTSWLASTALKGIEILDADAYEASIKYLTLTDLATPPDLLIIRMGVKVARNVACSEVLAEAINMRLHLKRPTWIWDQPDRPLMEGHLFWSSDVDFSLATFQRVSPSKAPTPPPTSPAPVGEDQLSPPVVRKTLRG